MLAENICEIKYAETIIMAMLTRLFARRIVARRRLETALNFRIRCADLDFSFCRSSRSCGPNEKNATSEPEISAEQIKRISKRNNASGSEIENVGIYRNSVIESIQQSGGSASKIFMDWIN
jgi:hypothetical protein